MGRIKSLMIKRVSSQLMEGVDTFSDDFEKNKKLLKGVMQYKSTRNKVAGYVTRIVKKQRTRKK